VGLNQHLDWPGVKQVCQIHRQRTLNGQTTTETAYFITSLPRARADADVLLELPRHHWGAIENGVHYVRDKTFDEDRCTICTGDAPQNLAALRNTALNWLRLLRAPNIAAALRTFARQPQRLLSHFGYLE
jgi:predicted transposase YbfD/YdcC